MYVCTNADANKNKFWEICLHDDNHVITRNGRIGSKRVENDLGFGGQRLFDSKVREKTERKGYKLVPVVGRQDNSNELNSEIIKSAATSQIAQGCPILTKLVQRLAESNRHQLIAATGGQMDINLSTGIVETSLGMVTALSLDTARTILSSMEKFVEKNDFDSQDFKKILDDYLMLVPQKVSAARGWHKTFLSANDSLVKQNALLDQLQTSIDLSEVEANSKNTEARGETPHIFDVKLSVVEDQSIRARVEKFYQETLNHRHPSSKLKIKRIFSLDIPSMGKSWDDDGAKMTNKKFLWHGTRTHNVLSILKQGFVIPKKGGSIIVTARMFGDGIYFSDQSTKSLNYSYGYWDARAKDNNCFMFLADVAMGKTYSPRGSFSGLAPKGYDSTFAKGGTSGIVNNEMIVYRTSQANLRYLVEFRE